MPSKKYTIIANWKMYLSYTQALTWLKEHRDSLAALAATTKLCIMCPSFDALSTCASLLEHSPVIVGAQDCSSHEQGAFTGQVSAQSLAQIGCHYSLVGHNETYAQWDEAASQIRDKIKLLIANAITPIVCIGETQEDHQKKTTEQSITQKLEFLITPFKHHRNDIFIAYEPQWAIGSGTVPTAKELQPIITLIHTFGVRHGLTITILYGGSVSAATVTPLKEISHLDGFLLGKASTDFQELKKVVSLLNE
jgi:triosephosphate isomerase (TIM)